MENQNRKKKKIWDDQFSTFWWVFDLDRNHPQNSPKVNPMPGYSKKMNQSEALDKEYLLRKVIGMMIRHGYHSRSHQIDIYKRVGTIINKRSDLLLVTLFADNFLINEVLIGKPGYGPLCLYLKELYERIGSGQVPQPTGPPMNTAVSKEDRLNIDKIYLASSGDLEVYCLRLSHDGFPAAQIQRFKRQYLEKFRQLNPDKRDGLKKIQKLLRPTTE